MPCAQSVKAGWAGSRFVRRSDRRAVERRSWNQNPNEFRHRVADTLARRRRASSRRHAARRGRPGPLILIAAPIGLGEPLAARVSLWAGLLGAIVSRTLAHRHHRRPQSHTIPVPCIGMVRQGRRARGGTRYRADRVHHPTGSPEQRVPPGPSSSICSRGTSTRRLTFAATPVIGAQLRPTIKRPNRRASLLPAAPS